MSVSLASDAVCRKYYEDCCIVFVNPIPTIPRQRDPRAHRLLPIDIPKEPTESPKREQKTLTRKLFEERVQARPEVNKIPPTQRGVEQKPESKVQSIAINTDLVQSPESAQVVSRQCAVQYEQVKTERSPIDRLLEQSVLKMKLPSGKKKSSSQLKPQANSQLKPNPSQTLNLAISLEVTVIIAPGESQNQLGFKALDKLEKYAHMLEQSLKIKKQEHAVQLLLVKSNCQQILNSLNEELAVEVNKRTLEEAHNEELLKKMVEMERTIQNYQNLIKGWPERQEVVNKQIASQNSEFQSNQQTSKQQTVNDAIESANHIIQLANSIIHNDDRSIHSWDRQNVSQEEFKKVKLELDMAKATSQFILNKCNQLASEKEEANEREAILREQLTKASEKLQILKEEILHMWDVSEIDIKNTHCRMILEGVPMEESRTVQLEDYLMGHSNHSNHSNNAIDQSPLYKMQLNTPPNSKSAMDRGKIDKVQENMDMDQQSNQQSPQGGQMVGQKWMYQRQFLVFPRTPESSPQSSKHHFDEQIQLSEVKPFNERPDSDQLNMSANSLEQVDLKQIQFTNKFRKACIAISQDNELSVEVRQDQDQDQDDSSPYEIQDGQISDLSASKELHVRSSSNKYISQMTYVQKELQQSRKVPQDSHEHHVDSACAHHTGSGDNSRLAQPHFMSAVHQLIELPPPPSFADQYDQARKKLLFQAKAQYDRITDKFDQFQQYHNMVTEQYARFYDWVVRNNDQPRLKTIPQSHLSEQMSPSSHKPLYTQIPDPIDEQLQRDRVRGTNSVNLDAIQVCESVMINSRGQPEVTSTIITLCQIMDFMKQMLQTYQTQVKELQQKDNHPEGVLVIHQNAQHKEVQQQQQHNHQTKQAQNEDKKGATNQEEQQEYSEEQEEDVLPPLLEQKLKRIVQAFILDKPHNRRNQQAHFKKTGKGNKKGRHFSHQKKASRFLKMQKNGALGAEVIDQEVIDACPEEAELHGKKIQTTVQKITKSQVVSEVEPFSTRSQKKSPITIGEPPCDEPEETSRQFNTPPEQPRCFSLIENN